jgi:hypothetical protein
MSKKIKFESFKYRFLIAAKEYAPSCHHSDLRWTDVINNLEFVYEKGNVLVKWEAPSPGRLEASLREARFYMRGDTESHVLKQGEAGVLGGEDRVKQANAEYFADMVLQLASQSGFRQ